MYFVICFVGLVVWYMILFTYVQIIIHCIMYDNVCVFLLFPNPIGVSECTCHVRYFGI